MRAHIVPLVRSFLTAKDCGRSASVSRVLKVVLNDDDTLWKQVEARGPFDVSFFHALHAFFIMQLLSQDFDQQEAMGPPSGNGGGKALPLYRLAYRCWAQKFKDEPDLDLLRRSIVAWRKIKGYLSHYLPEASNTLSPGATSEDIAKAEEQLKFKMPPALRAIYRRAGCINHEHVVSASVNRSS